MKHIEWYMNMIYYNLFRFDSWGQCIVNKIFYPLLKPLRYLTGQSEEKVKSSMRNMHDPSKGVVRIQATFNFGILCALYCGSVGFIISTLLFSVFELTSEQHFYFSMSGFPVGVILSLWVDKIFLEKNNKYLTYFKEFEKWNADEKKLWTTVTILVVLLGICLAIFAFWLFAYFGRKTL